MSVRLRRHLPHLAAVIGLAAIGIAVGAYILDQQRLRFPFIEEEPFEVKMELASAQSVLPGQGQTVRVSGVRVGDISAVELEDGRAVVTLALDPEYDDLVHEDATALLRPKTGLKDMFVELFPGSPDGPPVDEGFTIPVENTAPDVNLDEVLSALDADTRDYLRLLVQGVGDGLRGRGDELAEVFSRFEPTHRDLARVTRYVARRRVQLRRVMGDLRVVADELAGRDDELARLVRSAARVLRAFASEDGRTSEGVRLLPAALRETRLALEQVRGLAVELEPASRRLLPAAKGLEPAARAIEPLAREATPVVADQIRPFVREARPLVRMMGRPTTDLVEGSPELTRSLAVVNVLGNMLAFNPNGREGPEKEGREEGFLYWLAWLNHDGSAIHATSDAHGPLRPLATIGACQTYEGLAEGFGPGDPLVGTLLLGLEGVFTDPRMCGEAIVRDNRFGRRLRGEGGG